MFPGSVTAFIFENIDSVEQLEVLLLLSAEPSRAWSAEELSREMRSNPNSIKSRLKLLRHSGLVVRESDRYRFNATDENLASVVRQLAILNKTHRHRILELIFSPLKKARSFANAFRLAHRDEGEDDG